MFKKQSEPKQDSIDADAIGNTREQRYFQEEHSGHHALAHPVEAAESYYYGQFDTPYSPSHFQEHESYGWDAMASPDHYPVQTGFYLDSETNQYLALYGASELFG